jgi:RHS repeat-associated protein
MSTQRTTTSTSTAPMVKKIGVWQLTTPSGAPTLTVVSTNVWFAGRLFKNQDRLQSVGKYFPYGEDRYNPNPANPANDQEKFATYTRDAVSGLDYAVNRYYSAGMGRFMSADPDEKSAKARSPQTWNRYSYAANDPIIALDPTGMDLVYVQDDDGEGDGGGDDNDAPIDYCFAGTCDTGGRAGFRPNRFEKAEAKLGAAVQAIEDRTNVSAKCQKDLNALSQAAGFTIDLETIQAALGQTSFMSGFASTLPVSTLYGPGFETAGASEQALLDQEYGPGQTIGNDFARNPGGLTAETVLGGNIIYINPSLISNLVPTDEALLFHESLHELGLIDQQVQSALGLKVGSTNTKNISNKLFKDCIKGKANN